MQGSNREPFRVGDWQVEPGLNLVSRDGNAISLRPRVIDLLVFLSRRAGEVVSVNEIIDQVWDGVIVTDGAIYNCINELRHAFGDSKAAPEYIETISKRGYRLIAPVVFAGGEGAVAGSITGSRIGRRTRMLAGLLAAAIATAILLAVQIGGPPTTPGPQATAGSIAVLPFKDLSPDGDQEYFTDGITEELLNTLAGVEGLRVAARTSSFYFRDKDPSVAEVRQALGVAHILEGSVRRSGNRVRITAQLIDANSGFHLWSQTYDRELIDIFAIQDEISTDIVDALRSRLDLGRGELGDPKAARVVDPEAYTEYLLGRYLMNRRTPEAFEEAIVHFKRAIEADESYAPPFANMAITIGLLANYTITPKEEAFKLAKPLADRALALDPELAEAHGAMYFMESLQNRPDPNFKYLDRAIALNPSYTDVQNWKIGELQRWHRHTEVLALRDASMKIDPLSIILNINRANNLRETGRPDEARAVAERLKTIDFGWGQAVTGKIAHDRGDLPGAAQIYLTGLKSTPRHGPLIYRLAGVLSELGLGREGLRLARHPQGPHFNARIEGDWDAALKIARAGLEEGRNTGYFQPALAEALYFNRDYAGAVAHYEKVLPATASLDYVPEAMWGPGYIYYAVALRKVGDDEKAAAVIEVALNGLGNMEMAGYAGGEFFHLKGLARVYQGRFDEALDALEQAFEVGNRNNGEFAGPLLDPLRDHSRFLALQERYASARRKNRAQVLALICGDDLPDVAWQPLAETCEGPALKGNN